jgi:tetratricopeptide (TPR) repeat protein
MKDRVQRLLFKAVPRLEKGDAKAKKLRGRLIKVGRVLWKKGPRTLAKIGVEASNADYRPLSSDGSAFLEEVHEIVGDKNFLRFVVGSKKELARRLAEKKKAREEPPPPPPISEAPGAISDEGLAIPDDSGEGLAIPDDALPELAVPDDSDELPVPPMDAEDEDVPDFDLDGGIELMGGAGAQPLGIRFGDDGDAGDDDDSDPRLAGERALARFRRSGDVEEIKTARSLFKRAHKDADGPVAKGAARGGLALTYLLDGSLDKAKDHARKALAEFPGETTATSVLCRVKWPKEGEREQLQGALRRAEAAVSSSDHSEARAVAKSLKKSFPKEPFWALILLAIACDTNDGVEKAIGTAWTLYPPSSAFADLLCGHGLSAPVTAGCFGWLAEEVKERPGKTWGQTVKDADSKSNVVAGAYQIGLGLARCALAGRPNLDKDTEQQLRVWIAHGVYYSQHYDAAKEIYTSARRLNRESGLLPEINKCETRCGIQKRSFDKPGIKSRGGKFDGAGIEGYRKAIAARLKRILEDLEGDQQKFNAKEAKLVEALMGDPARRKKLKKRAEKAGDDDPFARIDGLDEIMNEGAAPKEEPKKKGGLFGRMKAAANKAIDKAKGAVAASKRKEALKALGRRLRDRPDGGWKDAPLDTFLDQLAKVEPRLDYLEEQATAARRAAGRAGEL